MAVNHFFGFNWEEEVINNALPNLRAHSFRRIGRRLLQKVLPNCLRLSAADRALPNAYFMNNQFLLIKEFFKDISQRIHELKRV